MYHFRNGIFFDYLCNNNNNNIVELCIINGKLDEFITYNRSRSYGNHVI